MSIRKLAQLGVLSTALVMAESENFRKPPDEATAHLTTHEQAQFCAITTDTRSEAQKNFELWARQREEWSERQIADKESLREGRRQAVMRVVAEILENR